MSYVGLICSALRVILKFVDYLERRDLISEVERDVIRTRLDNIEGHIADAKQARADAVAAYHARDGVPDDTDPYLRD